MMMCDGGNHNGYNDGGDGGGGGDDVGVVVVVMVVVEVGVMVVLVVVVTEEWRGGVSYHPHGPEGQQVVVLLAVAPGVPAGVLSLLQDVHLTTEVHLLETHEAAREKPPENRRS